VREGRGTQNCGSFSSSKAEPSSHSHFGGVPEMKYVFHRKFLRPLAVRSEEGFEVAFRGMLAVRYSEGEKSVTFRAEPAVFDHGDFRGRDGWMVAVSKPRNFDNGVPMTEDECHQIQERTIQALKFMKVPHIAG
jgi:hypothetical protein